MDFCVVEREIKQMDAEVEWSFTIQDWLVVLGNSLGHVMAVGDTHVFPGFLTPVLKQLFFPKPATTFLTCFCRGERRKFAGKKVRLNRGSNSQSPDHESDTLTTEPPGRGLPYRKLTNKVGNGFAIHKTC